MALYSIRRWLRDYYLDRAEQLERLAQTDATQAAAAKRAREEAEQYQAAWECEQDKGT